MGLDQICGHLLDEKGRGMFRRFGMKAMHTKSHRAPWVCVMKIFVILPNLMLLLWMRFWVDSPQSNSHISPASLMANEEWLRVEDGFADAVPRKVILIADKVALFPDLELETWAIFALAFALDCC